MGSSFWHGHATHPDWRQALATAASQAEARRRRGPAPTLGFVYFSDHFVPHASALYEALRRRWPAVSWVGCVGVGVASSGSESFDEPAVVLMLCALPKRQFQVFSGARPLQRIEAYSALVHADPGTPDLADLIHEMSARTASGYLFGGLASSRNDAVHIADGVWRGGLSGVAFTHDVGLVSRVTQGCQPVGPVRRVTAADENLVTALDGKPALHCLLDDLGVDLAEPQKALAVLRATLVGLSDPRAATLVRAGQFGDETRVRHLVGLDPSREAVAVADVVEPGMQLTFCQRDREAARRDLVRICTEIREEVESPVLPQPSAVGAGDPEAGSGGRIAGALYVSCAGRGGPHFGAPSAELQIVRRALGDVPLVGFFAGGEIAHRHLYGYTGVLTVFRQPG